MSTTIPGEAVLLLREALYMQLGDVSEDLASVDRPPKDHGVWAEPVARFDRTRAALDLVGWDALDPEPDAELELGAHRQAVSEALSWWLETQPDTALAENLLGNLGAPVAVTHAFLPLLTECLLGVFHNAAEEVEQCWLDAESYPGPLRRFDAIRAALDALDWGRSGTVDIAAHHWAIETALRDRLDTERHLQESAEAQAMTAPSAERQRERAYRYRLDIETFMADVGLPIPAAGGRDA
jgi:hypothetical protein